MWSGRTFGRVVQIAIAIPDDDLRVRQYRLFDEAAARRRFDDDIAELRADGFVTCEPRAWPGPEPRAGAAIVAPTRDVSAWISDVVVRVQPRSHGDRYGHRFVSVPLGPHLTACYYEITGYQTRGECAAFEDAFFLIERVAYRLGVASAPPRFIALSDVGLCPDTWYRVEAVDETGEVADLTAALVRLGTTLAAVREAREHLADRGTIIASW